MTTAIPRKVAGDAFASFAPHYDAYTEHPAYADWVTGLARLGRAHGAGGRRALDLACGTGKSLLPLIALGFEVTGCDAVEPMLARARAKAGPGVRLVQADVTALPVLGSFDLVTCLNDVCNYLPDLASVRGMLAGARANLAPGAVLVFDANTLLTFRTTFAATFVRKRDGRLFVWRGHATPAFGEGDAGRAVIECFAQDGSGWRQTTSVHVQRHHPLDDLARAVAGAGLELIAVHGQHDDGRRDPAVDERRHPKAVFVCRRPARPRGRASLAPGHRRPQDAASAAFGTGRGSPALGAASPEGGDMKVRKLPKRAMPLLSTTKLG